MISKPLLSLCIPTYNRAESLQQLLFCIEKQIKNKINEIELVISDNCSTDNTEQVVKNFSQHLPINYHKNNKNIGAPSNILTVTKFAEGKYIWIIGDDDLLYDDALEQVIKILQLNVYNAICVGFSYESIDDKDKIIEGDFNTLINHKSIIPQDSNSRTISWKEIFEILERPQGYLTSIVSHIVEKSLWDEQVHEILTLCIQEQYFTSTVSTFPHSIIWIRALASKEVLFFNKDLVFFFVGEQDWLVNWNSMYFTSLIDLSKFMVSAKLDKKNLDIFLKKVLLLNTKGFANLFYNKNKQSLFKLSKFIKDYQLSSYLWQLLVEVYFDITSTKQKLFFLLTIAKNSCQYSKFYTNFLFKVLKLS